MALRSSQGVREAAWQMADAVRARLPRRVRRRRAHRPWKRKLSAVLAIVALCALAAAFVGDNDYRASFAGWLPLIMVLTAIGIAFVYLQALKRGLSFEETSELHDCRRGDDIGFSVRFRNATPLLFFRIEAYFYVSDLFGNIASEASTTLTLSPFETYDLRFSARFDHIGTYSAGLSRVVITDFLRLFSARIDNDVRQQVHVTPRIQAVDSLEFSNESQLETDRPAHSALADSLDYAYVREYVPGDPLKTIHWKLSARSENYLTRLFEQTTNPGVAVIMDFYAPESRTDALMGMFDAVVETSFSVADYAQGRGMDTEVHYCNREGERVKRTSWGAENFEEIISDMPGITDDEGKSEQGVELFEALMRNQYGQNNLVVCTGNLSSRMISGLIDAKMRRRNPILFAIVPSDLVGRELEDWCAPLMRLDAANIGYRVLARSDELVGGGRA